MAIEHVTHVHADDGAIVIGLRGELDAGTVPALFEFLHELVSGNGSKPVNIDLEHVSFVDSSALAVFLHLRSDLAQQAGSIHLLNPTPAVRRVMEITGVLELFGLR